MTKSYQTGRSLPSRSWSIRSHVASIRLAKRGLTIEDVKAHYESKVPMGRGCFPEDVAKAIFYCVGQSYETGQAIPVSGGQVMLHA